MKKQLWELVFLSAAAFSVFLCFLPMALWGQGSPANVEGTWTGSFDITSPDGQIQHDTALIILKQQGSNLSGSAGPNENRQTEISDGKVDGEEVRFSLLMGPGDSLGVKLRLEGGRLKGEAIGNLAEGGKKIAIDTTRSALGSSGSQSPAQSLFDEISHQDSLLFAAYNSRDFVVLETFFTKDLEFYHDRDGLIPYQKNMDSFKAHFASATKTRRELVPGTLRVYPLGDYGAVELGEHRFYSTEPGQPERLTATASFVHVWQHKDGAWKISRVVSYDHH